MRYCPSCRRINEGWPDRCRHCQSSFNLSYCAKGHPNPPGSGSFCGVCGSADLSQPATGGRLINAILGFGRHKTILGLIVKLGIPLLLLIAIAKDPERYIWLILPIVFLFLALRLAIGILPFRLVGLFLRLFRSDTKKYRASQRNSRGQ